MTIGTDKLRQFPSRFIADLGATVAAGNVMIGHRLGLYQALAAGPAHAEELAARTQTNPRYITEWLCGRAHLVSRLECGCALAERFEGRSTVNVCLSLRTLFVRSTLIGRDA